MNYDTLLRRCGRVLVEYLHIPPQYSGYRFLPRAHPWTQGVHGFHYVEEVASAMTLPTSAVENILAKFGHFI